MEEITSAIIEATVAALKTKVSERFYETERGYQGAFYCLLNKEVEKMVENGELDDKAILEMEHQKFKHAHDLTIRPDIVLHIPREETKDAAVGNYAVFELKHHKKKSEANLDFYNLCRMFDILKYPLGFFIVVDSKDTCLDAFSVLPSEFKDRVHTFAVKLNDGQPKVMHGFFDPEKGEPDEKEM